ETGVKVTWLVPHWPLLSSEATGVRLETEEPVYTASKVLKALPLVVKVTLLLFGAVQFHQTDLPPVLPAWLGSPVCLVASTLFATKVIELAEDGFAMLKALAKLSFRGHQKAVLRAPFRFNRPPVWERPAWLVSA